MSTDDSMLMARLSTCVSMEPKICLLTSKNQIFHGRLGVSR